MLNQGTNDSKKRRGFTLVELLIVIGLIGFLAVLAIPALKALKRTGGMSGAQRQILEDISYARQLAILNRTTVYMVFVPPDLDAFVGSMPGSFTTAEKNQCTNLLAGKYTTYNFVSLRSVGDQPGRAQAKYYGSWKSLPEGILISTKKFTMDMKTADTPQRLIRKFAYSKSIPFPQSTSPAYTHGDGLPYIAFTPTGQLSPELQQEQATIPLSVGNVLVMRDPAGHPAPGSTDVIDETPSTGTLSIYNLIEVNRTTGRGKYITPEVP